MASNLSDPLSRAGFLADAFSVAAEWHASQRRKSTTIPYISHLMAVSSLVLEHGGDTEQAAAGLLHDSVEDAADAAEAMLRRGVIGERFGGRVLRIVEACTDGTPSREGHKPPWAERKTAYLAHLKETEADALLVSAADKLHNARAILGDLRALGDAVYERFNAGKEGTLWYYGELAGVFRARLPGPLSEELSRTVDLIREGGR